MKRKWHLIGSIVCVLSFGTLSEGSDGIDMAVMERWASANAVNYHVEGLHNARAAVVSGDYEGKADVIDSVVVEFTWDVNKRTLVGSVTVADGTSELRNLNSDGTNCPPPTLDGEYEHFQSVSSSLISDDQIQVKGTRTYPPASVSNYPGSCSMRTIPGGKEEVYLWVARVNPEVLGMPTSPGDPVSVSADRTRFTITGADNWVWTYTPERLQ